MAAENKATREVLQELEELLRTVTSARSPHRLGAVRYTEYRTALLKSDIRSELPGFLVQCVSIDQFHDFINLYDPGVEARLSFLEAAFAKCRTGAATKRTYDVFKDFDF